MVSVGAPPDFRIQVEFDRDASGRVVNTPMTRGLVRRRESQLSGWTDISDRLRSFRLQYGRSDAFSRIDSATASAVLDNRDRLLDPLYPASPYYPKIEPKRNIQIRAQVRSYAGYVMVGPPVGYWPLDEAGGDQVADYTDPVQNQDGQRFGRARIGVLLPSYPLADTIRAVIDSGGTALTAATITIPASDALALTGTMTIEAWVYPYSTPGDATFIYKPDGYRLDTSGGVLRFSIFVGGAWVETLTHAVPLVTDTWQHVLGTYDGRALRLYYNGGEVAGTAVAETRAIAFSPSEVYLLSDGSDGAEFDGAMAQADIYNRPMSATQVRERYIVAASGYLNLFTGPSEEWLPDWPNIEDAIVRVTAADGFESLASNIPKPPTYDELIAADHPLVYLPMQDDKGSNSNRNRTVANAGEEKDYYATRGGVTATYPVAPSLESGSGGSATSNGQLGFYLEDYAGPLQDTNDRALRFVYTPVSGGGFQAGWLRADFEWFARSNSTFALTLETWFMHDGFNAFSGVDPIQTFIQKGRAWGAFITYLEEFTFIYTTDGVTPRFEFRLQSNQFPSSVHTFQLPYTLQTNRWYHIACRFDQTAANEMAIFVDGVKVGHTLATGVVLPPSNPWTNIVGTGASYETYIGRHQADGGDEAGIVTFTNGRFSRWAAYDHALSDERIAARYALYQEGYAENPTGTQAAAVLDDANWPAAQRSIDTGVVTAQRVTLRGVNLLEYLRRLGEAEQGAFLIDRNHFAVFQDRLHRMIYQRYVAITLSDEEGTSTPYMTIKFAFDLRETFNRVTAQRVGAKQPIEVNDEPSQRKYHTRTLDIPEYIGTSDDDLQELAEQKLRELKTPTERVSECGLLLVDGNDERWPAILSLSYGDTVLVRRHPSRIGNPILAAYRVEQYEHAWDYSTYIWSTTLVLSSARYGARWVLGDPVYSVLGETTRL